MNRNIVAGPAEETSGSLSLPLELRAEAARRLSWLALIYAGTFFLAFFPAWITHARGWNSLNLNFYVALISISGAILIAIAARKSWFTHSGLLVAGLCFEVVGAFGIALSEAGGFFQFSADKSVYGVGISWVCTWIIFFPLVLPSRPRIALLTSLFAASMGPLAFLMVWLNSGRPPLPQGVLVSHLTIFYLANYICAGMAYIGARIIYRLGTEVARERELGSYRLEARIDQGGMGEVWKANHRMLIRPAAIKIIRPDKLGAAGEGSANILRRFEREAQATAALQSPHTVELYDFGVNEDGTFYYVMEMLDGLNMDSLVSRFGPVPYGRAAYLLQQVCHSLSEAHQRELIHRDIKPANLFVCRVGLDHDFVKVLDFGLVRRDGRRVEEETRLTTEGLVGGTPAFLPPEMALGNSEIDGRADIYALGCVAYWLLTGELVFRGSTPMEYAMKHVQEEPVSPSSRTELEIPETLEETIMRCLKKDPAERPQSAAALALLLEESAKGNRWSRSAATDWWSKHLPSNG